MPDIVEKLIFDFHFSCNAVEAFGGQNKIHMETDWKGGSVGSWQGKSVSVNEIRYRLSGTDPLTGRKLSEDTFTGKFTAMENEKTSNLLSLNGVFQIRFDAVLSNGEVIRDFREPFPLELSCERGKPKVEYSFSAASRGWMKLTLDCNCSPAVSGKLWLRCEGRTQMLPPFKGDRLICYLPNKCDNAFIDAPVGVNCEKK